MSYPILFPLCHLHQRKTDQNEVSAIQDLLQCIRPIAYSQQRKSSTERGHLISQVKSMVPELLLGCSMQKLHNDLITSPYDGGLLVAIHADTNDVIISDTMLRSLAPPQLRPVTDHQKMICGCAI